MNFFISFPFILIRILFTENVGKKTKLEISFLLHIAHNESLSNNQFLKC